LISSIEEIYLILIWIIPGYFGYVIDRYFSVSIKKQNDLELIIFSLAYSLVSYGVIFSFTPYSNFALLQDNITSIDVILLIWTVPMSIGLMTGLIQKVIKNEKKEFGDCWIVFQDKLKSKKPGVTIYTIDGKEIEGILNYAGKEDVEKEIIITDPKLILRNSEYKAEYEVNLGKEMLFTDKDINRISFWEHY